MSSPRPFEPISTPQIGVGSRLLVGRYPNEPATVVKVVNLPSGGVSYQAQIGGSRSVMVGEEELIPVIPWLWTPEHGRWVGEDPEPLPPYIPNTSARCFGPPLCETCAEDLETMRSGRW